MKSPVLFLWCLIVVFCLLFWSLVIVVVCHAEDDVYTWVIGGDRMMDAIGAVESSNRDDAISSSGDRGRYQISPIVMKEYKAENYCAYDCPKADAINLHDPVWNKAIAKWYLLRLFNHYRLNTPEQILAAYHIGPTKLKSLGYDWKKSPEAVRYINAVMAEYRRQK